MGIVSNSGIPAVWPKRSQLTRQHPLVPPKVKLAMPKRMGLPGRPPERRQAQTSWHRM